MQKSESIAALAEALAKAQGEMENASKNSQHRPHKKGAKDLPEEIKEIHITCRVCGKTAPANSPLTKTCSPECKRKWRKRNPEGIGSETTCPHCGKTFRQLARLQVYCHPDCQLAAKRKRDSSTVRNVPAVCVICGKNFLTARAIMSQTCGPPCTKQLKRIRKAQQDVRRAAKNNTAIDWSFETMSTNCECKTWDCAEMDPMSGGFPMITFSVPVAREVAA